MLRIFVYKSAIDYEFEAILVKTIKAILRVWNISKTVQVKLFDKYFFSSLECKKQL